MRLAVPAIAVYFDAEGIAKLAQRRAEHERAASGRFGVDDDAARLQPRAQRRAIRGGDAEARFVGVRRKPLMVLRAAAGLSSLEEFRERLFLRAARTQQQGQALGAQRGIRGAEVLAVSDRAVHVSG